MDKKKLLIALVFLVTSFNLLKAEDFVVSGYVRDKENGEAMIGARVYIPLLKIGAKTNSYGFYSFKVQKGEHKLEVSYTGYKVNTIDLKVNGDVRKDIELSQLSSSTEEITVVAKSEQANIDNTEMSSIQISTAVIQKMPALLGEVDLVRSIQLLPGVSTVGEGASGFNVRGGSIDQNLILLDEAPVFNVSHLFGFFSVFNPDAVKDVKLIKGGIPSNYGGRISSILDVRMKEGNSKKFEGNGGIGLIFSRLALESPIDENSSFIIAGRRSYIDILAKPFLDDGLENSKFYFYDLTLKANYKFDDFNQLFLSGYLGRDEFGAGFKFNWGNQTGTLRWNSIFSDDFFSNITLFYSDYDYAIGFGDDDLDRFDWNSRILNYSAKADFNYYYNPENLITFGGQATLYDFNPGSAIGLTNGVKSDVSLDHKFAMEFGLYAGNESDLTSDLSIQYGIRYSHFNYLGKGTAYYYGDGELGKTKPVIDTTYFGSGEVIQDYGNFEPRFSVNYKLNEESSLKASYNRISQYIHLISNTTAATPVDVWTPSTNNIKPQIGDQVALGYFSNYEKNEWETSIEVFYKDLQNQIDYVDGADLLLNPYLEGDLLSGKGRAYGAELYIKKSKGDLTGWVSYTLSKTERQIDGINKGLWFPTKFDRTHNLNIVVMYKLSNTTEISSNFIFNTGTPATFPTNRIELQNFVIPHNSEERRNNYRIPVYHRLDFSLTYTPENQENDLWQGRWVFSIYNVYNRKNPFSIYFRQNELTPQNTEAVRFAVLGTIVPAVSYNFKF